MLKRALIAAILSAGPAAAQDALFQTPVTDRFTTGEFVWNSQMGKMDFAWAVIPRDGKMAVCGVYSSDSNIRHLQNLEALNKGWVKLGGKKVVRGLQFFTFAGFNKPVVAKGVMATCKLTKVPATNATFQLGWDPIRVRV
ncbi:hypothetical protein VK792_13220 [Mesobacterium sp. TK19101]|uniref:Uncharacterized protein n=1 Tax=Mesobacterium hydrothermale TaxID=3111907 RepID=A0ABU6HIF6_9RHOB|nr:hypothetical protein [Mesobacterium sp. TK19101]MEC3862249.1 hypothetical protein [Mesobacterium sp. TK19101]